MNRRVAAPEEKASHVLFYVSILLAGGLKKKLAFRSGDIPEDVAFGFCQRHKLSIEYYDRVVGFLRQRVSDVKSYELPLQDKPEADSEEQERLAEGLHASSQTDSPNLKSRRGLPRQLEKLVEFNRSHNNDVLHYFSQHGENFPSTDRYLIEELCQSANDSIDQRAARAEGRQKSDVFNRLYGLARRKAPQPEQSEAAAQNTTTASRDRHPAYRKTQPRRAPCAEDARSSAESPGRLFAPAPRPARSVGSGQSAGPDTRPHTDSAWPEAYYSHQLEAPSLSQQYRSVPLETIKVKHELQK